MHSFDTNRRYVSDAALWQQIKRGSLSFALASRFLPEKSRVSVWRLYSFCRFADDTVDNIEASASVEWGLSSWQQMHAQVEQALKISGENLSPVISGLRDIHLRHQIPTNYVFDLLAGMQFDCLHVQPKNNAELDLYCYQVAGTVGAMFCYIVGVKNIAALKHAIDLGCAMQLTNIARDVMDDFRIGRIYLPADACAAAALGSDDFEKAEAKRKISAIVNGLLARADELYKSGDKGLVYLSLRTAFAVAVARKVYSAIGWKVSRKGVEAWDERVYVTGIEKIALLFWAAVVVVSTVPARLRRYVHIGTEADDLKLKSAK